MLKLTILQKVRLLFILVIVIFITYITTSYFFTQKNVGNLNKLREKSISISLLHTKNLYLFKSMNSNFYDFANTAEEATLKKAQKTKEDILKNLQTLATYEADDKLEEQQKALEEFFLFSKKFTKNIRENSFPSTEDMNAFQSLYEKKATTLSTAEE